MRRYRLLIKRRRVCDILVTSPSVKNRGMKNDVPVFDTVLTPYLEARAHHYFDNALSMISNV